MDKTKDAKKSATNTATGTVIDFKKLAKFGELFKAISHPLRMKIIEFIDGKQEVNVNIIYNTLKLEQSITSQHLKILRNTNVVLTRRDGKKIFYSLNYDLLTALDVAMSKVDLK